MPVHSHGRTTAVCRPERFPTLCLGKKSRNGTEVFWYAPTDHFTSVDVPVHTTVRGELPVYYGHQRDKCFSLLLCSFVLCGLVENWFKLVNRTLIVSACALVNLEVNTGRGCPLLTVDLHGFSFCYRCRKRYSCGNSQRCKNKLWVEKESQSYPQRATTVKISFFSGWAFS